jgi:CBS domain containing-hemolysin-like protein
MAKLGRLPMVDDFTDFDAHRIVVREVDGRRVSRVLVSRGMPPGATPPADPTGEQPPPD